MIREYCDVCDDDDDDFGDGRGDDNYDVLDCTN